MKSDFILCRVLNSLSSSVFIRVSTALFTIFVVLMGAKFSLMSAFCAVLVLSMADVISLIQSLISVVATYLPLFSFNSVPCSVIDVCVLNIAVDTADQSADSSVTAGALCAWVLLVAVVPPGDHVILILVFPLHFSVWVFMNLTCWSTLFSSPIRPYMWYLLFVKSGVSLTTLITGNLGTLSSC